MDIIQSINNIDVYKRGIVGQGDKTTLNNHRKLEKN